VEQPEQLPDLPRNAALLDFLRRQASWPGGADGTRVLRDLLATALAHAASLADGA
jgi:hypothetical protein